MLFRIEPVPFYRAATPIPAKYRWIEGLAVLPYAVEGGAILNLFLCRTDKGLQRIEERQIWEAMEKGQFREARRAKVSRGS